MKKTPSYLTRAFLKASKDDKSVAMALSKPQTSYVQVAMQYLGHLVTGSADILRLVWHPRHSSMLAFVRDDPEGAKVLRVSIYVASVPTMRRCTILFGPIIAVPLVDPCASSTAKQESRLRIIRGCPLCIGRTLYSLKKTFDITTEEDFPSTSCLRPKPLCRA